MKFLIIDGKLLKNKTFLMADKVLLSYIFNLQKAGKKFFGTINYLSDELGSSEESLEKRINFLIERGVLRRCADGIELTLEYEDLINYQYEKANVATLEKLSEILINKFKV